MLGLENPIHILFLLAVLLMVFGAKRLPEMGKGLGEGMRGFKDALSGHHAIPDLTAAPAGTTTAVATAPQVIAAPALTAPQVIAAPALTAVPAAISAAAGTADQQPA